MKLRFSRDAVHEIALKAMELKTGARALRSILEKLMLDVMYEVPHRQGVAEVVVDRAVVLGRKKPMVRLTRTVVADKDAA